MPVRHNVHRTFHAALLADEAPRDRRPRQGDTKLNGTLIGVDLGPNLSVTGSLATILWLMALRREGEAVTVWQFLKLGIIVMPPALVVALLAITAVS
jgi:arsenical pump membrane protein